MENIQGQRLQTDEGLQGNEKIESAIKALQQNPSEELLAHALTIVRRRMRDKGQFIVAVDAEKADGQMQSRPMTEVCGGRLSPASRKKCAEATA